VPPLRNRQGDVGLLSTHFINHIAKRLSVTAPSLKKKHVEMLEAYDWPGNVRELENVIERALITSRGGDLSFDLSAEHSTPKIERQLKQTSTSVLKNEILTADEIKDLERENIILALEKCQWKIRGDEGAAILLGIKPTTLSSKIKALKISRSRK
jgi:transcriptional regulator with GAF, ATPase, and Fis domain